MFEGISGHKKQIEFLKNATVRGRLAHAYTFAGPDSVGKRTVALRLAQGLLASEENHFHPDLLEINGQEGIKIEQIRELVYKLALKPYAAQYKIAIIDAAENMTAEAANALLKCLEEPKPQTIIILVTNNPNLLPKTIISRTQKITFGPVAFEEFQSLLPTKLSREQKRLVTTVAAGKPGLALKIIADEGYLNELEQTEKYYKIFIGADLPDKLVAAYEIADWETPQIKSLLEAWMAKLESALRVKVNKQLAGQLLQVSASHRFLGQNANAKLLLTNLMINT